MAAEPLVNIKDLHKAYGPIQVLKGLDIEMEAGERVVVIGPSGGGKSTLLRVMMGLLKAYFGWTDDAMPSLYAKSADARWLALDGAAEIGAVGPTVPLFDDEE